MNMFKRAFVRGIAQNLVQRGLIAFPSEEFMTRVADYIAERTDFSAIDPASVPNFEDAHAVKSASLKLLDVAEPTVAKVAKDLILASKKAAEKGKVARALVKAASAQDLHEMAVQHAVHLMRLAEGSTIEGGDKGNSMPSSGEGMMDDKNRPPGYATNSQGTTGTDVRPGAVGTERPATPQPGEHPSGSNSVTEQARTANLNRALARHKAAEGSTIEGGDKGNSMPSSGEGMMDDKNRPPGYAELPNQGGRGELGPAAAMAAIGEEQPHPNTQNRSPAGSNSVVEQSRTASADLAPEYVAMFERTAAVVQPMLPATVSREKAASLIQQLLPLSQEKRARHLAAFLNAEKAPRRGKVAEGNPFEKMVEDYRDGEGKGDEGKDKKDGDKGKGDEGKDKDKKDGDKGKGDEGKDKEASVLALLTRKAGG